jgi:hypothetical protein
VASLPLFDDQIVTPTELNRRSGEVLRSAAERPVTIVRAEGDLVLMQRAVAAELVRATAASPEVVRALAGLVYRLASRSDESDWVLTLDAADIHALATELADALRGSKLWAEDLSEARAVLQEWRETTRWARDAGAMARIREADAAYARGEGVPVPLRNGDRSGGSA